jgi:hypothetical protein
MFTAILHKAAPRKARIAVGRTLQFKRTAACAIMPGQSQAAGITNHGNPGTRLQHSELETQLLSG